MILELLLPCIGSLGALVHGTAIILTIKSHSLEKKSSSSSLEWGGGGDVAQLLEYLSSMPEAIPQSTAKSSCGAACMQS